MTYTFSHAVSPPTRQAGAALIIGLVLLISLTIVGISVLSTTSLEQRMAGNMTELNLAFNNAETGGQAIVAAIVEINGNPDIFCQRLGLPVNCDKERPSYNWWDSADNNYWNTNAIDLGSNLLTGDRVVTDSGSGSGVQRQPQAIVEGVPHGGGVIGFTENNGAKPTYRITVRGTGTSGNTEAILQQDVVLE